MDDPTRPSSGSKTPISTHDTIYLRNLRLSANVEPDAWGRRGKSQPIIINLQLHLDTTWSGISDDLQHSFSYGQMCKDLISHIDAGNFDFNSLGDQLLQIASRWPGESVDCKLTLPKALLLVEEGLSLQYQIVKRSERIWEFSKVGWHIKGLKATCIIGVNAHERLEKQTVNVELHFSEEGEQNPFMSQQINPWRWRSLVTEVNKVIEDSAFETLEALAALIAKSSLINMPLSRVEVIVEKPSALPHVEASGVRIIRDRGYFSLENP